MAAAKHKANGKDAGKTEASFPLLAAYVRMWAVGTSLRVLSRAGRELVLNEFAASSAALAFIFPLHPIALLIGYSCRVLALLVSLPYVHDSQNWCGYTDMSMIVALIAALVRRSRSRHRKKRGEKGAAGGLLAAFSDDEAAFVTTSAGATIRFQFLLFYAAAALYKFNEGFMHPRFSCAPVYLIQIVEQNVPASVLATPTASWILTMLTTAAPTIILLVEAVIPVLLWIDARVGASFAALFHWAIAITPPPNDIASFGTQTLPRLLLLMPEPAAAAAAVASLAEPGVRSLGIVGFAALTTALQPITWNGDFDFAVPICGAMAAVICVAAATSASPSAAAPLPRSRVSPAGWVLRVLAVHYAFVAISFGSQDMGTANMFSSLRMHGGSNHYFLPTGLLQRWFADLPPDSTVLGNAFGGGVIRIMEGTNSSHLTGPSGFRYPGELLGHTPGAVDLLVQSGHSGRQWSPMAFACAAGNKPWKTGSVNTGNNNDGKYAQLKRYMGGSGRGGSNHWNPATVLSKATTETVAFAPFDMYTLSAPEIRRIIRDARSRFPDESFDIHGALLPGLEGDEEWRATASAEDFVLRRRTTSDGGDTIACVDAKHRSEPCSDALQAILLAPPSMHPLAIFFRKVLLQQPYPILEEDAGAHRRVHCFGP